jgi:hypothetical protein
LTLEQLPALLLTSLMFYLWFLLCLALIAGRNLGCAIFWHILHSCSVATRISTARSLRHELWPWVSLHWSECCTTQGHSSSHRTSCTSFEMDEHARNAMGAQRPIVQCRITSPSICKPVYWILNFCHAIIPIWHCE